MKFLKNNQGMTLVEVMVALAMLGVLSFSFTQLLKTQSDVSKNSRQDEAINAVTRMFSQALSDKTRCDSMLAGSLGPVNSGAVTNLSSFLSDHSSINFLGASSSASSVPSTGIVNHPIDVTLSFQKNDSNGKTRRLNQVVKATGQFENGNFIACVDTEETSRRESLRHVCEMVGATFVDNGSGNESCDFSTADEDSQLAESMKKALCENLYKGTYDEASNRCDSLEVVGKVFSGNLQEAQVRLGSGSWRSNFNQECLENNQFIRSVGQDGVVSCIDVKVCTPDIDCEGACTPDCSCAATTNVGNFCADGCGGTCAGTQVACSPECLNAINYNANQTFPNSCGTANACAGTNCDYLDQYYIQGGAPSNEKAWASSTQVCRFRDYQSPAATPGSCGSPTVSDVASAGLCKKFSSCSESGQNVVNVANGTECGLNKECNNGTCEDVVQGCTVSSEITFCGNASTTTAFTPAGPPVNVPFTMPDGATYSLFDGVSLRSAPLNCNNGNVTVGSCTSGDLNLDIENVGGETGPNGNYTD